MRLAKMSDWPRGVEPGPDHLRRVLRALETDLSDYPLAALHLAPERVQKAHARYTEAREQAEAILAGVEAARDGVQKAHEQDVDAAAKRLQEGAALPSGLPYSTKAAEAVRAAGLHCEAAERHLIERHEAFVAEVEQHWATWRQSIMEHAIDAARAARRAWHEASAALVNARDGYQQVLAVDHGVRVHNEELKRRLDTETRCGLPWYTPSHIPARQPLYRVAGEPLENVVGKLNEALAEEASVAEWLPPDAPGREDMQARPYDLSQRWTGALLAHTGPLCVVCGLSTSKDAHLEMRGAEVVRVHARCRGREVDTNSHAEVARLRRFQREGYPEQPGAW